MSASEAANFALRQCPPAQRFYERKQRATNRTVALKAVAHKLARACYYMLLDQQPFDVTRCLPDGSAQAGEPVT
jgi:transposase